MVNLRPTFNDPPPVKVRRRYIGAWGWGAFLLSMLMLGLALGGSTLLGKIRGQRSEAMAVEITGHFSIIRTQVERSVLDRGWDSTGPEHFDESAPGKGGIFDALRTGVERPDPPIDAAQRGGSSWRYALEVGDFTGGRGKDHVAVLRGLREDVCQAINRSLSKPPDPYDVDPGDRYARAEGCIVDPDSGDTVAFVVLNAS